MTEYYLEPQHYRQQSFRGKAVVKADDDGIWLYSCNLLVAGIISGIPEVYVSADLRMFHHIKEFLLQNGFKVESREQVIQDYFKATIKGESNEN